MDRSIRKLSILGPALAILLAVGLLGPATGVAAPASLAEPAAFEFFVPADQTASDTLTLNNSSAGPLNWGLTLATGGTDLVGNWILDYDWDCAGAPDSLGITFHPELTFTTSEGPSGTWTQTYNQVLLNLPGGTQYTGYIAGQVMTGTMSSATGLAGCWEAGRVIAGPVSLLSGERTASGEPAEAPGTEVAWVVPDPQPVERVTLGEDLQPTAVKEGTGG